MGGGKSSSSSAPVVTEEQKAQLRAQTGLLPTLLILRMCPTCQYLDCKSLHPFSKVYHAL